jgi:NAD(P)-dependent dehydrogenase (short-subunit alcohol dehydrogenase family)
LDVHIINSAGQPGPFSAFLNDPSAAERKDAGTLGQSLFDNESFEAWSDLYRINTFSIFFGTTAFLGLLEAGSKDVQGWTSSVVNVTSVSGLLKIAQCHVIPHCYYSVSIPSSLCVMQFAYNSAKAAASHLTKMVCLSRLPTVDPHLEVFPDVSV